MVHQDVALAQHREQVDGGIAGGGQRGRRHGRPRLFVQVRPVEGVDPPQSAQVQRGAHAEDAIDRHLQLGGQQLDELLGHVGPDLESQGATETAALRICVLPRVS